MTIRLRNSLTRKVEDFVPIRADDVRMYVCGPTVYDRAHLGNARPVVVFDVLYRLLRHVYGEGAVTYVRNFTDVDDKINAEALRRREAGAPGTLEDLIAQRTEETIGWYHADMDALGALRPSIKGVVSDEAEPRATAYIEPMKKMIATLIVDDHAYVREGHVLFRVRSYSNYGALSGRSVDDMIAGARVEVAPFKEDPLDFVLWKPSDAETPGWDSPWGRGRPGWHIECSAMSYELLGDTFDIHGGGIDLAFPHHENEIAQSACAHPEGGFAKYWVHNEMLLVEGRKMSKSLGNFFTVRDLLDQGVPGEVIRFVLLGTHYSKPMDWTEKKREEAEHHLRKWYLMTERVEPDEDLWDWTIDPLVNDLNGSAFIARLHELAHSDQVRQLRRAMDFIGFPKPETQDWHRREEPLIVETVGGYNVLLRPYLARWEDLRRERRFAEADALRDKLQNTGLKLSITSDGASADVLENFDPSKLEGLL